MPLLETIDADEDDSAELDTTELDTTELDATELDATELEAIELETTELEAMELVETMLELIELETMELDEDTMELVVLTVDVAALKIEELVATELVEAIEEVELEGDGHVPQPHFMASFRASLKPGLLTSVFCSA